jgi:hypothetical protein
VQAKTAQACFGEGQIGSRGGKEVDVFVGVGDATGRDGATVEGCNPKMAWGSSGEG